MGGTKDLQRRHPFRRVFRWLRITALFLVFALATALFYLNVVGIPGFAKARIVAELERQGWDVQFTRVRLHGVHKIVAENLRLAGDGTNQSPSLFIHSATLQLDPAALRRFSIVLEGLDINKARFDWLLTPTNLPPRSLSIDHIVTELKFRPDDHWELSHFTATTLGAQIRLSGSITNLSALPRTRSAPDTNAAPETPWQQYLYDFVRTMEEMHFAEPPRLILNVAGDVRRPESFGGSLQMSAPAAEGPWGKARYLELSTIMAPSRLTNSQVDGTFRFSAAGLQTPWGEFQNGLLKGHAVYSYASQLPSAVDWTISSEAVRGGWGKINGFSMTSQTVQTTNAAGPFQTRYEAGASAVNLGSWSMQTNRISGAAAHAFPRFAHFPDLTFLTLNSSNEFHLDDAQIDFASRAVSGPLGTFPEVAGAVQLEHTNRLAATRNPGSVSNQIPAFAKEYRAFWRLAFARALGAKIELGTFAAGGSWNFPALVVTNSRTKLDAGGLDLAGQLDLESRMISAAGRFDGDLHAFRSALPESANSGLANFAWEKPPVIEFKARFPLPGQTVAADSVTASALSNLWFEGSIESGTGAVFKVPLARLSAQVEVTNSAWSLRRLEAWRPEGAVVAKGTGDIRSNDFHFEIETSMDLAALKPAIPEAAKAFDLFEFSHPPRIQAEVRGRWGSPHELSARGSLSVTNFIFRSEPWGELQTTFSFTNLYLNARDLHLTHRSGRIDVPHGGFDIKEMLAYVTNATSTLDPAPFTKVIGPETFAAIEPYHFIQPPSVRVNGRIPTDDTSKADLHFEVESGPFEYWRFKLPRLTALLHWHGDNLTITNLSAPFYDGHLLWQGEFAFLPGGAADFGFKAAVSGADLKLMMADLLPGQTHLEGRLGGNLVISSANSDDWKSWNGSGNAELQNGFLWNIPIFGVFSPLVATISPAIGKNTISSGMGTFTIERSVIHTKDMEVRSPAMRLRYSGTVDFDGNVEARTEAQLLRDAWVFGRFFSLALWPLTKALEYKVTGTLTSPKTEPLHIPKAILMPLRPWQTIKEHLLPNPEEQTPKKEKESSEKKDGK